MFADSARVSAEKGNGVSRNPSPTEKHNEAIIPITMIGRLRLELLNREMLFISEHQEYQNRPCSPKSCSLAVL